MTHNQNNIGLIIYLYNVFMAEFYVARNLTRESSETIEVDASMICEQFRWLNDKNVELSTIDIEDKMNSYREFQQFAVTLYNNHEIKYDVAVEARHWAMEEWIETGKFLDEKLARDVVDIEYETFNDYRPEAKIINYLVHFAEKMSKNTLLKAKNRLFERRNKKEISYDTYVKAMLMVLEQVVVRFGADQKLYDKFCEMDTQLHSVQNEEGHYEIASMNISMEDIIDMKRDAEKISARQNVSVEEAFLMIQANREGIFDEMTWNLEIV